MNRIEFMKRLEELLQDISLEERNEAIQYYNDYFNDAGIENEEDIIKELGSPEKVAMEVKAGLRAEHADGAEYRETGYTDTRFEEKEQITEYKEEKKSGAYEYTYADISQEEKEANKAHTNKTLRYILIGVITLFGLPIAVPLAIGIVAAVFGILLAILAVVFAGIIVLVVMVIVGIALVIAGFSALISRTLAGLALIGIGLIVGVLGVVASVGIGYICIKVLPKTFRRIGEFCKKTFKRKEKS